MPASQSVSRHYIVVGGINNNEIHRFLFAHWGGGAGGGRQSVGIEFIELILPLPSSLITRFLGDRWALQRI